MGDCIILRFERHSQSNAAMSDQLKSTRITESPLRNLENSISFSSTIAIN